MGRPLLSRPLLCALTPLCVLGGCAQTAPPVVVECKAPVDLQRPGPALVGQSYGMSMSPMPIDSVHFGNRTLAQSMAVQGLYAQRMATGTVQLQARFVSCADAPARVYIRTSFMRTDTAPSEPASAWKPIFLQPRATAVYEEFSTSREAVMYLIEVTQ